MARVNYKAYVEGFEVVDNRDPSKALTSQEAVELVRLGLASLPTGTVGRVIRESGSRPVTVSTHRAYVVDPGGIVRRTDRTPGVSK